MLTNLRARPAHTNVQNTGIHCMVLFIFALGIALTCPAQQLRVGVPVHTENVVLTAFNTNVQMAAGAELPGTGIWKFSGTNEIELSNTAGAAAQFPNVQLVNLEGMRLVDGAMHVGGNLLFGLGILRTSAQEVVFGPASSVSNARNGSFIEGFASKEGSTDFVFPLGANGLYHPVEVFGVTGGTASFRARYFAEGHPDPQGPWFDGNNWPVSTCDYWQLERSAGTAEASVRLDWSESECNVVNDNQYMRVSRYMDGAWQLLPSDVGSPGDETVSTTSNQGAFGDFALASIGGSINTLPIELLHFSASADGHGAVQCNWSTASEVNNDYFILERSIDGSTWEIIERISGAGFSNTALHYDHPDMHPFAGQSYYRLQQVDFDGAETVYPPVAVYIDQAQASLGIQKAYRNGHGLHIHYEAHEGPVLAEIFDLLGKRLFSSQLHGEQHAALVSPQLPDGLYILRLSQEGRSASVKFRW